MADEIVENKRGVEKKRGRTRGLRDKKRVKKKNVIEEDG